MSSMTDTLTITVIEPEELAPVGRLGEWLFAEGASLRMVRPWRGEPIPSLDEIGDGLVVLGGSMSAHDEGEHPWLADLRELLRGVVADDVPAIAICLGAQGAAEALVPAAEPWRPSRLDSAGSTAVGVVTGDTFPVVPGPRVPRERAVIYEAHVKGLTYQLPGVPEELRGTYAGLAHSVTVEHLKALGITTIELLPIHASVSEPFLTKRGLSNYWGYSTLSYFAPEPSYATAAARAAGRRWVR